eukprot:2696174-Lingulodinium_polyedra.AAC.1
MGGGGAAGGGVTTAARDQLGIEDMQERYRTASAPWPAPAARGSGRQAAPGVTAALLGAARRLTPRPATRLRLTRAARRTQRTVGLAPW